MLPTRLPAAWGLMASHPMLRWMIIWLKYSLDLQERIFRWSPPVVSILSLPLPNLSGSVFDIDGFVEGADDRNEGVGVGVVEDAIEAFGVAVGEGGLVEEAGVHDAVLGEEVDDVLDKADLIGGEVGVF